MHRSSFFCVPKKLGKVNEIKFLTVSLVSICVVTLAGLRQIGYAIGMECGTVNVVTDLVRGGNEAIKGAWPFVAVLYQKSRHKLLCGGTLISNKHVLTAAHCIQSKDSWTQVEPHDLVVHLGVYNLTAMNNGDVVSANISRIDVNPDWDPYVINFDADLAILVLSQNVTFTKYIRPVCIPGDSVHTDSGIIDMTGTIVGWGLSENETYKEIPRQAIVKALNDSFCYGKDTAMASFSSNRTFCGGFGNGSPEYGDSGTGFYVLSDNVWVQYGIVSAMRTNRAGYVIPNSMAVYSNVKAFKQWIVETVEQSEGVVGEAMMTIQLACNFGLNEESKYECWVKDLDITRENILVSSINGSHISGKSNEDVEYLQYDSGSMMSLPNGIGKVFRNLNTLKVGPNLNVKILRRSHFENMKSLVGLHIFKNDIDILDGDILWDLPELELFHIENNGLTEFHESTFEKNEKLKYIVIQSFHRLETLPENLFRSNLYLEAIILNNNNLKAIPESIFESNGELRIVGLALNKLEYLPTDLFKNSLHLELIDVDGNFLKTLNEQIFEINTKLLSVSLNSNLLRSMPENLFKNNLLLYEILLTNNSLQSVDGKMLGNNVELKTVLLGFCSLQYLPLDLFANNSLLVDIDVSENFIRTIDAQTFENNVNLQNLNLSTNMLEHLPTQLFGRNLLLTSVDISNNSIKTLDEQIFALNIQLEKVYLSFNQLEFLPRNIFKSNLLLTTVDLGQNSFKTIDGGIFTTNSRLENIFFYENQLESLPKNLFDKNLSLRTVDFNDNVLLSIEVDFRKLSDVGKISLQNNLCINETFYTPYLNSKSFKSLTEFQNLLTQNCS